MNRGEEDYLKAIFEYELKEKQGFLISNQILMKHFHHTAQTVIEMIKKLVTKGMVEYTPYKGSTLTNEGRQIASQLIRKHRIWETFLVNTLHYNWDQVHEEAEHLEHVTSELLTERLYEFLGFPQRCPHGNFIPKPNEIGIRLTFTKLLDVVPDLEYQIVRVADNHTLLTYLNQHHIGIQTRIKILSKDSVSKNIIIQYKDQILALGFNIAKQIDVIEVT